MLAVHLHIVHHKQHAVQAICVGFSVPITHRKAPGWETFLKELGLVPSQSLPRAKATPKSPGNAIDPEC